MLTKLRRNKKGRTDRGIFFSIFIAFLFLLIISFLTISNIKINQKRRKLMAQIHSLKDEVQRAEERKEKLKNEISQAKSEENIEKVARDQLGLKKPGEEVLVIKKKKKEESTMNKEKNKNWWDMIKSIFNR